MTWKHDDLANDLAEHLRTPERMIWTDMQLGPAGSPRPDVYSVPKSYSRFTPLAYEIKISVADFRSDVTSGKWQSYLRYAAAVTFAVPAGLITKSDLPAGCGLIVRGDDGWRTLKAPTLRPIENLPLEAWQKLLMDGVKRLEGRGRQDRAGAGREGDPFVTWHAVASVRKRLGEKVANFLKDEAACRQRLERARERADSAQAAADKAYREAVDDARERADREVAAMNQIRADLCATLALPPTAHDFQIRQKVRALTMRLDRDEE
ncbi:MmcB family DNA repair protein, partial [Azospirillum sp. TSO5]|uniref:MmcB family DNA repair protein n=1 Tax=Azospirillum sp. TSO5 TaxID=716760 RepID=UPI000D64E5E1